jgi:phosphoglycerate dehydrogenase-like enzyme
MPRVIITPHTAAFSFVRDIVDIFCDNYQRWITGMPLRYAVDFERGY